ncbi:MAG: hypothetical protein ACI4OJ_14705 [Lachnospiraceae bacterium]
MNGTDQDHNNRHRVARAMYLGALAVVCLLLGSTTARLLDRSDAGNNQSVLGVSREKEEEDVPDWAKPVTSAASSDSTEEAAAADTDAETADTEEAAETAASSAAVSTEAATEADTQQAESADPGLLETGEDYVAMERSDLDAWAENQGMTVTEDGNTVTYEDENHKLVVTLNDAGNCVRLAGSASGTPKEQYDWYEDYIMFVTTGEIYGRCEGLLVTLRDGASSDFSLISRSSSEDGVEVLLDSSGSSSTLTLDRPSGGPFIEF